MEILSRRISRMQVVFALMLIPALLANTAGAQLPRPDVEFIPEQISAGSSFVIIADPGIEGSLRITWVSGEGYGLLPYTNAMYMCYFSETDEDSLCGPSPFRLASTPGFPYLMDVSTFDSEGNQGNTTIDVDVGGLKINPIITVGGSGRITMVACVLGGMADSVTYKVYGSDFTPVTSSYHDMTLIPENACYNASVDLGKGTYYIAFKADSADDFGGGIEKVSTGSVTTTTDYTLEAEKIDVEMFVDEGTIPAIPVNKKITNTENQAFDDLSIVLPVTSPINIRGYISARLTNTTISPNGFLYYNVSFIRAITSGMDINTEADIMSGTDVLGKIPIRLKISVQGGGGSVDCTGLYDGAKCLGGICCLSVCRAYAECCSDSDCGTGETCGTDYRCSSGVIDKFCSSGTCRTGLTSCPSGQTETGSCASGGSIGICCLEEDECSGKADMESCYSGNGVCCDEECIEYGECCGLDSQCGSGKECIGNYCSVKENGGEGFDFTLVLVIAVIALAGVGVWWYLTKYKKKGSSGEEELKEGDEVFDEEEFY
jgi:hypothetical protein